MLFRSASENIDKGKSILGAPPKLEKRDVKNHKVKKANSQKPKQKSSISVIIMEQLIILDQIASG